MSDDSYSESDNQRRRDSKKTLVEEGEGIETGIKDTPLTQEKDKSDLSQILNANNAFMREVLDELRGLKDKGKKRHRSPSSSSDSSSSSSDQAVKTKKRKGGKTPVVFNKGVKGYTPVPVPGKSGRSQAPPVLSDSDSDRETLISVNEMVSSFTENAEGKAGANTGNENEEGCAWADELLTTANEECESDENVGEALYEKMATYIQGRFTRESEEKKMKELLSSYKRPSNCPSLTVKMTNDEIWSRLDTVHKKIDAKYTVTQTNISKATTAIALCADNLRKLSNMSAENTNTLKCGMQHLFDAITILGNAQNKVVQQRKDAQRNALPHDIRGICGKKGEGEKLLYGDNLSQLMKEAREERRLASQFPSRKPAYGQSSSFFPREKHFLGKRGKVGFHHRRNPAPITSHAQYGKSPRRK